MTETNRREDYRQRIPIEGKFGQGKHGYGLNYIQAKRADTSQAWINSIFLVMNRMVLLKIIFWLYFCRKNLVSCYDHSTGRLMRWIQVVNPFKGIFKEMKSIGASSPAKYHFLQG